MDEKIIVRSIDDCSRRVQESVDINADYVVFCDGEPTLEISKVGKECYLRNYGAPPSTAWRPTGLNHISLVVRKHVIGPFSNE